MENEVSPLDRLFDLVIDLLEDEPCGVSDITDTVEEAIITWRNMRENRRYQIT